MMYSSKILNNS